MAIDIGNAATDRASYVAMATVVAKGNPANATGTLTSFQIYVFDWVGMDVEVATFYVVSGNNLSTRDSQAIGYFGAGLNTVDLSSTPVDVNSGDYLGVYLPAGAIDCDDSGGDGLWVHDGDMIPCTDHEFTFSSGRTPSIYATGVESASTTDYVRSVSVTIASKVTTARALTIGRSVSPMIGVKATSSKGIGKSSAISLGIVATASRVLGMARAAAVVLGSKVTAARALALSRSKSVSVGAKVAGSRGISLTRMAAVSTGIVAMGTYLNMIVKAATVAIGSVVTASRALGLTRAASLAIGTKAAQHYASTMHEHYNTGDIGASSLYTTNWRGQTFTPSAGHTVTSVKLLIYRTGNPGTFTVSIRGTAAGVPSGADLCSGTTDGDALSLDGAGEWKEITFGTGTPLSAGTIYAIVARSAGADSFNSVCWRVDSSSPTYSNGTAVTSSNSGSAWTIAAGSDYMFEEWAQYLTFGPKLSLLRSGSVASGIVGVGNRVASAMRAASVSVEASITASRVFAGLRSASVSAGTSVTSTAVKAFTRTAAISSGIVATASRGFSRTASIALGIVAVGSKAAGTFSTVYQAIAVKLNAHAISSALNARAAAVKENVRAIAIRMRTRV